MREVRSKHSRFKAADAWAVSRFGHEVKTRDAPNGLVQQSPGLLNSSRLDALNFYSPLAARTSLLLPTRRTHSARGAPHSLRLPQALADAICRISKMHSMHSTITSSPASHLAVQPPPGATRRTRCNRTSA